MNKKPKSDGYPNRYADLIKENQPNMPSSIDRLLPGEEQEIKKNRSSNEKLAENKKSIEEDENAVLNVRISKRRKDGLQVWFKAERDQNLSAGLRGVIVDFMRENEIPF